MTNPLNSEETKEQDALRVADGEQAQASLQQHHAPNASSFSGVNFGFILDNQTHQTSTALNSPTSGGAAEQDQNAKDMIIGAIVNPQANSK